MYKKIVIPFFIASLFFSSQASACFDQNNKNPSSQFVLDSGDTISFPEGIKQINIKKVTYILHENRIIKIEGGKMVAANYAISSLTA